MRLKLYSFWLVGLIVMSAWAIMALADVTGTAAIAGPPAPQINTQELFGSVIAFINSLGNLSLGQILALIVALAAGCVGMCGGVQHILEIVYAYCPWLPWWVKPALPKALGAVIAAMLNYAHVDMATATSMAGTFYLALEGINKSPLALDLGAVEDSVKAKFAEMKASTVQPLPKLKPLTGGPTTETVQYADGSTATGAAPMPRVSPTGSKAVGLLMLLFALLVGQARASVLDFAVPLSPAAGTSYVNNTIVIMPSVLKDNAGNLMVDFNAYGGIQSTWQWGSNYGFGLTFGILAQGLGTGTMPTTGKLAGGIVGDFIGLEAGLLWANDGARLGFTKAF